MGRKTQGRPAHKLHAMPNPRVQIEPSDAARWAALRGQAAEADDQARALGPKVPILDAIAWLSGFPERGDELRELIEQARQLRCTWREIAVAVGESNDRGGESRTQARHNKWVRARR